MGRYDDIIDHPRHVSPKRQPMSRRDRAAQFSPFAALNGYEDAVEETARLTGEMIELDESEIELLNRKLVEIRAGLEERNRISVTYFVPDERKSGGRYEVFSGELKRIDELEGVLIFRDGKKIAICRTLEIEYTESDG